MLFLIVKVGYVRKGMLVTSRMCSYRAFVTLYVTYTNIPGCIPFVITVHCSHPLLAENDYPIMESTEAI